MSRRHLVLLLLVALLGLVLFVWRLGATGLVDETPPLFAASARAMAETGDWLIPRVNGLPRYDKPPLVYWLMGLLYALPGQEHWNPLGTWAARLPSALASVAVMVALADTLLRWPQPSPSSAAAPPRAGATALAAALAFALSPLVLLWSRTAVSDALLTAMLSLSLLCGWRTYAGRGGQWWPTWLLLGLAVLTKGPVAIVLVGGTLLLFGWLQADLTTLWRRLRPLRGLLVTALVTLPWYGLALWRDGRPFWDSFFGYHNLQRFTSVVNDHLQPWWFFGPVLIVASLPLTPVLLLSLSRAIGPLHPGLPPTRPGRPASSLARFAACWLLVVLLFFTLAATKLPSYWLPATPAAGLLIALGAQAAWQVPHRQGQARADHVAWGLSLALATLLGLAFLAGPLWVPAIHDPEMPSLPSELLASGRLPLAGALYLLAATLGGLARKRPPPARLLALQLPLLLFVPTVLEPLWSMGDRLRGLPVRTMARELARLAGPDEPVAMVGILKPSLHYYGRRVVIYEGIQPKGLVNLADRLGRENRPGQHPGSPEERPTVVIVIDRGTADLPYWRGLGPTELGRVGLYRLWRLDRSRLEQRAGTLRRQGHAPDWQVPVPERY